MHKNCIKASWLNQSYMKEKSFFSLKGLIKRTFQPGSHLWGKMERAEGGLLQNFQKRPLSPPSLPFSVLCVSWALRDIFPFLGNPRLIGLPPHRHTGWLKQRRGWLNCAAGIEFTQPILKFFQPGHPVEEPDGRAEGPGQIFIVVVAEMRWKERRRRGGRGRNMRPR